jgi:hypothetical protein
MKETTQITLTTAERIAVDALQSALKQLNDRFVELRKQLDDVVAGVLKTYNLPTNTVLTPVDAKAGIYTASAPEPAPEPAPAPMTVVEGDKA